MYWDGLETKKLLSTEKQRDLTLVTILMAVDHLIEKAKPNCVTMMTREPNLPDKAITKYQKVASFFGKDGYIIGEDAPYHGRRIWFMRKKPN